MKIVLKQRYHSFLKFLSSYKRLWKGYDEINYDYCWRVSGGIISAIAGGKFADGFRQGLITNGLNHVAHLAANSIIEKDKMQKFLEKKWY